jgi:hypothetical protein
MQSLNKIDPAATEREALRKHEYEAIRQAYLLQPDSLDDADDWSNAETWSDLPGKL